jgi:hypothetical protein
MWSGFDRFSGFGGCVRGLLFLLFYPFNLHVKHDAGDDKLAAALSVRRGVISGAHA